MTAALSQAEPEPPLHAGLATRTIAFAIDAAAINVVAWFVGIVVALGLSLIGVPDAVLSVFAIIAAGLALGWTIAYFAFFWSASGQTPGNRVLGITVRDGVSGGTLRPRRAVLRVFALPLSALPFCAGFLMILYDPRRRALHDRIVHSLVVYAPPNRVSRRAARTRAGGPTG